MPTFKQSIFIDTKKQQQKKMSDKQQEKHNTLNQKIEWWDDITSSLHYYLTPTLGKVGDNRQAPPIAESKLGDESRFLNVMTYCLSCQEDSNQKDDIIHLNYSNTDDDAVIDKNMQYNNLDVLVGDSYNNGTIDLSEDDNDNEWSVRFSFSDGEDWEGLSSSDDEERSIDTNMCMFMETDFTYIKS